MTTPDNRPPFIEDQGIRLLAETEHPERFLRAEYFRAGRSAGPALLQQDVGSWLDVDRLDVAFNRLKNGDGSDCDLSRLAVTTDAGVGKTTAMRWLHAVLNRPQSQTAAFLLAFHQLPPRPENLIRETLLPELRKSAGNQSPTLPDQDVVSVLERMRDEGRLVLLLDGLDQAPPDGSAVRTLRVLLEDHGWGRCRVIISGRPHALQRHWRDLFDRQHGFGWRFVQLDEFNEAQQRRFLGRDEQGRDRFDLIPLEAREILSTPRVLEYLRDLPGGELAQVNTAADVYWQSINHLLKEGMMNSQEARRLGLAAGEQTPTAVQARSLRAARKLLGAIAFEMTSTLVRRPEAATGGQQRVPNFDGVPANRFERFKDKLIRRLAAQPGEAERQGLERDVDALAALNDFVAHGIFDTDVVGLDRILWRNRTLQEFFTAYWLSQYCTPLDAEGLWDWVYLPEAPLTDEYYWVWRFVCEMHPDARDPQAWTRAVGPLYRPGDGTAAGTKRSCEMIYRAWQPLEQLVREGEPLAEQVQANFLAEFEQIILAGRRGVEPQQAAEQFRDSFLEVPAGEFRMGAPEEKQGMPDDLRKSWDEFLQQEGDPEERAEQLMADWPYAPGKQGQEQREADKQRWVGLLRERDVDAVARLFYPANETPERPTQQVEDFLLSRWATTNAWYRLFSPDHGEAASYFRQQYARISPEAETPVIFVSWYEAWVSCQWACWDGQSCRLPHEFEWEYAAKAGTAWDQNYWWGDEFEADKCNAEGHLGRTMSPSSAHANPWGFEDILGNVWEWCQDGYRRKYDRDKPPDGSARVLRGGSWDGFAALCRSAYRFGGQPTNSGDDGGFRVARAVLKS